MSRPTLENGDIWSEELANASIRPQVGTQDEPGFMPPITNSGLSDVPGNIKSDFYNWYDRLELTVSTGLQLTYNSSFVTDGTGTRYSINPGNVLLSANTTGLVFVAIVSGNALVTASNTLPLECLPLARYTTNGTSVTSLIDLRGQVVDRITPIGLPSSVSPFSPGDIKSTLRVNPEAGWLLCQGQILNKNLYPALFDVIGYTYGGAGDVFKLPDLRGRSLIGAGQGEGLIDRTLGSSVGKDKITLSVQNMPSHGHGIRDEGHSHSFNDPGHTHVLTDSGHTHGVNERPHSHRLFRDANRALIPVLDVNQTGAEVSSRGGGNAVFTESASTGVSITRSSTGITLQAASSNGSVVSASSNISVSNNGGNQAFDITPPAVVINWMIKL